MSRIGLFSSATIDKSEKKGLVDDYQRVGHSKKNLGVNHWFKFVNNQSSTRCFNEFHDRVLVFGVMKFRRTLTRDLKSIPESLYLFRYEGES